MKLDKLIERGWRDAADYFRERDMKYGTTELKVLPVLHLQTADITESSALTTFGKPMETLDSIPGESQMPQVTSRPGFSHMRLDSRKPQTHKRIPSLLPAPMPDWSLTQKSKHVEPISFNPSIMRPKVNTT